MISVKLFKVVLTLLFSLSSISIIKGQTTDSGYEFAQHPVSSVFSDNEIRLLQSTDSVTLTPLEFEKKMFDSWVKGRNDAIKDLAKNATATGVGLDVERVLEKNDENKLGMTPSEIENQVAFAYQLGGLHSINNALKASGHSIDVPKMRIATPEEYRLMHMRERELFNRLMRGMRVQGQKQRQRLQFQMRQPLRMRMRSLETDSDTDTDTDATYRQRMHYLPTEVGSVGTEQSQISLSPFEGLSPSQYSSVDQSSIEPSTRTHYEANEPQIVLLRPVKLSHIEQSEVESAANS